MPITYEVHKGGHFIHAVASGVLTGDEFVEYEVAHAIDERIKSPVSELLEVQHGACRQLSKDDVSKVLERRRQVETAPRPHRCAIVVSLSDERSWDLAKFYEGMVTLHRAESVIVFGDIRIARTWLGFEDLADTEHVASEKH